MKNAKSRLLIVILLISLCFNVFFLGSYLFFGVMVKNLKTPQGRQELASKYLKLSEQQKEKLADLSRQVRNYRKEMEKKHGVEVDELCSELSKSQPNYDKITQIIDIVIDGENKFNKFHITKLEEFSKTLTQQQRQMVVKEIKKLRTFINRNSQ